MRICQILQQTFKKERNAFIKEICRQMLHREPDQDTKARYAEYLAGGGSKNDIVIDLLHRQEAAVLYAQGSPHFDPAHPTVASILHEMLKLDDEAFVRRMYGELFYREPESYGIEVHVKALRQGAPRISMIGDFLNSEEWFLLLSQGHLFSMRILSHFLSTL